MKKAPAVSHPTKRKRNLCPRGYKTRPAIERFLEYIDKNSAEAKKHGCWLSQLGQSTNEYCVFHLSKPRRSVLAHRFSYAHFRNNDVPLPSTTYLLHDPGKCSQLRNCVNPDHLIATNDNPAKLNAEHRILSGRSGKGVKRKAYRRLKPQEIETVRALHQKGWTNYSIARYLKRQETGIGMIVRGISYPNGATRAKNPGSGGSRQKGKTYGK